jgi:HlyD family secretion protein
MIKQKKWLLSIVSLVIFSLIFLGLTHRSQKETSDSVLVKKGAVAETVIAVGSIVPEHSISIKSHISGIVGQLYHAEGDFVRQGDLLIQVLPSPTPSAIAEAYSEVKQQTASLKQAESHRVRLEKLLKLALETPDNYSVAVKEVAMNKARLEMAKQKLDLIQNGKARIGGKDIKTMVYSPISGYILKRNVDVGDPVVPLTDMQEGTALFVIADMQDLIFKGLVNEMDVAKIHPGMLAQIHIAALPDANIKGTLHKINLQSNADDVSTSSAASTSSPFNVGFSIELSDISFPKDMSLHVGYSATAEIITKTASDVLVIPERVLLFKNDKIYVNVQSKKDTKATEIEIKLGISDGINVQVLSGVKEGDVILDSFKTNVA